MAWSLKSLLGGSAGRPSIDWLDAAAAGFSSGRAQASDATSRAWRSAEGDAVSLHLFPKPPDLPAATSLGALEQFYRQQIPVPAKLVEACLINVGGQRGLQVIMRFPQQPSGMAYVGSITVPFRDLSFVIKAQCEEHGMTGVREAILFDREQARDATGAVDFDPDAEPYDREFPQHPVSRARRHLRQIASTARWAPQTTRLSPFLLPDT